MTSPAWRRVDAAMAAYWPFSSFDSDVRTKESILASIPRPCWGVSDIIKDTETEYTAMTRSPERDKSMRLRVERASIACEKQDEGRTMQG